MWGCLLLLYLLFLVGYCGGHIVALAPAMADCEARGTIDGTEAPVRAGLREVASPARERGERERASRRDALCRGRGRLGVAGWGRPCLHTHLPTLSLAAAGAKERCRVSG